MTTTVLQAVKIMQKRKYTAVECQDLVSQLQAYKEQQPSLQRALGSLSSLPKLWWQEPMPG